MGRILLVDNEAGDRRAAARVLGIREQELESVESVATALVRAAEAGHPFVLVSPAMLEASLGARPSSSGDLLRETFDVFEDGVCLLARNGSLKVANAIGERLFRSTLQAELQSVASEASTRSATVDARSGACSPRSSRRSGCWLRVSRTRSTTRPRSCWRTSRR